MMATERTRVAGIESGDAPTAEQSTHFDARDRLAGRLDDTTVEQAVNALSTVDSVLEASLDRSTPGVLVGQTTEERVQ